MKQSTLRAHRVAFLMVALTGLSTAQCRTVDKGSASEAKYESRTAVVRDATFSGRVFVSATASEDEVKTAILSQTKSLFGPLSHISATVATPTLQKIDLTSLEERRLDVVDEAGQPIQEQVLEVRYEYKDRIGLPKEWADKRTFDTALANGGDDPTDEALVNDCVRESDRRFSFWMVWDPSLAACQKRIRAAANAEQRARPGAVAKAEATQQFLPITVRLGDLEPSLGKWPEYHRLFAGGVAKDKLVIGILNSTAGRLFPPVETNDDVVRRRDMIYDVGYDEWLAELDALLMANPDFELVRTEPDVGDIFNYDALGEKSTAAGFQDLITWTSHLPFPISKAQMERMRQIGARIIERWLVFEKSVWVTDDSGVRRPFTIQIQAYYGGTKHDDAPHRRLLKTSDVVVYNGHSYGGGQGPFDPRAFRAEDFPPTYQLIIFNACSSFNYYHEDYFRLKGGTAKLDMVVNASAAAAADSGLALGRLVAKLIDGSKANYRDLLEAASPQDNLRIVDGELDNEFDPSMSLEIEPRETE